MTGIDAPPLKGLTLALAGFAIALTNFSVVLDLTITNVAVPHIAGGLAVSPTQGTWTVTSYAVAEGICLPLTGWLTMRYGLVRTYLVALVSFGLFSMLCGFAQTLEWLVVGRVLQGFAGAPLLPASQTLILRVFPEEKRGMAMGLWAMTTICAPILGPILGGYLSDNWSWPWIFLINVPVIAVCFLVLSQLIMSFDTPPERQPIDVIGLILLIITVASFQIMIDTGQDADWFNSSTIIVLALTAAIGAVAFVIWELNDPHPVVDLRIFRFTGFRYVTIAFALSYGVFFASIVLAPLWLQRDIGYTASEAGYAMCFTGVMGVMMAPLSARLMGKIDLRISVSMAILWIGFIGIVRSFWTSDDGFWTYATPQLLQGLAIPFYFMGLSTLSISAVPPHLVTSAVGLTAFFRTLGGAIATTMAIAMWDVEGRVSRSELIAGLNDPQGMATKIQGAGLSNVQANGVIERLIDVQASTLAMTHIFLYGACLSIVAAAVVWLIPKAPSSPGMVVGH
ncbi:MAG: DHA2 family efflux MFS transporter permease subunit [Sphingomonadaceae bacterium]